MLAYWAERRAAMDFGTLLTGAAAVAACPACGRDAWPQPVGSGRTVLVPDRQDEAAGTSRGVDGLQQHRSRFFPTVGIPLQQGRDSMGRPAGRRVAIVSAAMARFLARGERRGADDLGRADRVVPARSWASCAT